MAHGDISETPRAPTPAGRLSNAQPVPQPTESLNDSRLGLVPDGGSPRLRYIASEEQRAHQQAALVAAALEAIRVVAEPVSVTAGVVRSGLHRFLKAHLHDLHRLPDPAGSFGFNQVGKKNDELVSVKPLLALAERSTSKLERHVAKIVPSDQIALMVRGQALGFQGSMEQFSLFVNSRADREGMVGKERLKEILEQVTALKLYVGNVAQRMDGIQCGLMNSSEGGDEVEVSTRSGVSGSSQRSAPQLVGQSEVEEEQEAGGSDDDLSEHSDAVN